jgi:LemA protein
LPTNKRISAWEIREHLLRQVRRLRFTYRVLIIVTSIVIIGIISHVIYYYNYLINLQSNVITEDSNVMASVQYRRNLMPVLINSVVSFVDHEDSVFNRTVDARVNGINANRLVPRGGKEKLESALKQLTQQKAPWQSMLSGLIAIAEQYPDLKTSEVFQVLMTKVSDAETSILERRTKYNEATNAYLTAVRMFPGNIYSVLFGFPKYDFFDDVKKPESETEAISQQYRSFSYNGNTN